MTKPTSNLRLFVGVYPPEGVSRAMLRALERLPMPPHRATPPSQVHLTLQFVGDVPARELDDVIESVERSAAGLGPFTLTPRRLVSLPERGRARLVAAETDSPANLLELQRRLAHRLARNARQRAGDRFLPHLTLCRFRDAGPWERIIADLAAPAFDVLRIVLVRSTLRPEGAEHHAVREVALAPV